MTGRQKRVLANLAALPLMVVGLVQLLVGLASWPDWTDIFLGVWVLALGSGLRWLLLVVDRKTEWRRQRAPVCVVLCIFLAGEILIVVRQVAHWQW